MSLLKIQKGWEIRGDENMLKFRLYYDKDEEQEWLKKMCLKGWDFKKFFLGFYTFEQCEPGEYSYQIDLLDSWSGDKDDYVVFMEEAGVEVVGQWWRWVWLKKRTTDGPFEMYTDKESKITHYSKIKRFFAIAVIMELVAFFMEIICAIIAQGDDKYTPLVAAVIIALIALAMFKIVLKCRWKIKQLKNELGMS